MTTVHQFMSITGPSHSLYHLQCGVPWPCNVTQLRWPSPVPEGQLHFDSAVVRRVRG